jgi:predicted ATPase/signal transduction histidine kinase
MNFLPGYEVVELLDESSKSLVYRGWRIKDRLPVILKILNSYSSVEDIARFRLEYEITRSFNLEGVVKAYGLETYNSNLVIILEDFGGTSLNKLISNQKFSLKESLELAKEITLVLGQIHQQKIVHKDINPSNIVFNPVTKQLKLIDFGIASDLSTDDYIITHPHFLEGNLAYISPEQTGRMNRHLDYRSDFYSLGITLYQLLCDRLPFTATEPIELVHCHLAKQAIAPQEINQKIPTVVSNLVIKLLAKNPEERYQSSWGIYKDLEECLQQLETNNTVQDFVLASQDIVEKWQLSQKLYGREKELFFILNAFKKSRKGRQQVILIAGECGIGKTTLVRKIEPEVLKYRGYFITGKYESINCNIPYYGLIKAFQELIDRLLIEPEANLNIWRNKLLTALGNNGQIIIDLIPQLELIIGKQNTVTALAPAEERHRFNLVWLNFINVFATADHPLVIFLDDLQWADAASLNLIQILLTTSTIQYLLIIGAYRTEEVDRQHPLSLVIDEIQTNIPIKNLLINGLTVNEINHLIVDSFMCKLPESKSLAELVVQKTAGNPFFMNRWLKSLYQEKLIFFEFPTGWHWDLELIKTTASAANVIELIIKKLHDLSENTQQVLKIAACIGDRFELKTLALVINQSLAETAFNLTEAVKQGSIVPNGNQYKYLQTYLQEGNDNFQINYKFIHDRVQQTVYSLLSESEKQSIHLKIGRILLDLTPFNNLSEKIFTIVNHLNLGRELITEPNEKQRLIQLNLLAGKKAQASSAYTAALTYFNLGRELLEPTRWLHSYQLTLELYSCTAEAAYLNGDYLQMEKLSEIVLRQAKTPLERVAVYQVKIQAYIAQNQFLKVIATAREVLQTLGVKLPRHPSQWDLIWGKFKTKLALKHQNTSDLANLPLMRDANKLAAMKTIASVCTPTYFIAPKLWQLMVFQKIQLSLKYGNAAGSPFGYADYGMLLAVEGNFKASYEFAQLSLNLLSRLQATEFKSKTFLLVNIYIRHWKEHLKETLAPLLEAYHSGLAMGDLEYAVFCLVFRFYHSYLVGRGLSEIAAEMAKYDYAITRFNLETPLYVHKIYYQVVLNLLGETENPLCLVGRSYNETQDLATHREKGDRYTIFHLYLNKLILCYLFADYSQAVVYAEHTEELLLTGAVGMLLVPVFYFYASLAHLAIFPSATKLQRKKILTKVAANQKKMQTWAHYAPMNYLHKYYLVEAEQYRLLGKTSQAIETYDRALNLAKEHQYLQETALIEELTAKSYLDWGKTQLAKFYLSNARDLYLNWGAVAKVKDLEQRYPQLLSSVNSDRLSAITTSSTRKEVLELTTVIKASQTLSMEMLLDKLLEKLIQILIENAGAEKGCLILETQGKLSIEARGTVKSDRVTVFESIPLEASEARSLVSTAIINYVARTQESIVIKDATIENKFNQDTYIIEHQPRSILCIPLCDRGKLVGILYLENNLTTDAFTPERVEILQLLSTQAAISLENARLYNEMELRVKQRTAELTQVNQQLEQLTTELQRSNQELEQFAYIASHDLQEPLRAVASYTQMLAKRYQGKLDEKADIYIGFAVEGAMRMQQLIQDLLTYSRVGRHQLKRETTDCNLVVNKVLKDLQIIIKETQAAIAFDSLPTISADTAQITLLFQNLISNSLKYRSEASPQISITASQQEATWLFQVCDNGIGIDPQYTEQIFNIFERLHPQDEYPGTGLGLAICQKIVERHGGKIWVESELGKGASFYFELPI